MWPVARKFALFGDAGICGAPLRAFVANYDAVLAGCDAAWQAIRDQPSKLAQVTAAVDKTNAALAAARDAGCTFCCLNCELRVRQGYTGMLCQQCGVVA